jgi:hypothetical protein
MDAKPLLEEFDIGEDFINLQHHVGQHEDYLDALTKRIAELTTDLEVILRVTDVVGQVRGEVLELRKDLESAWSGTQSIDPALLEKYRAFLERYGNIG